jgi:methylthioribulose-1-phosphate dehydratase
MSFDRARFADCADAIAAIGRELAALGWTPATSSNFSMRLDERHAAITISGRDKGRLSGSDVMVVDFEGKAVGTEARPSAETLLHTQLYQRDRNIGAVLHTHSLVQTLASKVLAAEGQITLSNYELLKAFAGFHTHQASIQVPVFQNTQEMPELVQKVEAHLQSDPHCRGYLIEGHGIYSWGRDLMEAKRHLDAFEFLLTCELELRKIR